MTENDLPRPDVLPVGLPEPIDDGRAAHLPGTFLPPLALASTDGAPVRLDHVAGGRWVLFVYPTTGDPDAVVPAGWDDIPGARGCSQEACSFRDNLAALRSAGVHEVYALSSDSTERQRSLVDRFHLAYALLSDPAFELADALRLPTFDALGERFHSRLTLALTGTRIDHVFYPVVRPGAHAEEVVAWHLGR